MGREVERYTLDDEDRVTAVTNLEGQVFTAARAAWACDGEGGAPGVGCRVSRAFDLSGLETNSALSVDATRAA